LCAETVATMFEMLLGKRLSSRNIETVTTRLHISDRSLVHTTRSRPDIFPGADSSACFYDKLLQEPQSVLR
jgi:hypothetical protein